MSLLVVMDSESRVDSRPANISTISTNIMYNHDESIISLFYASIAICYCASGQTCIAPYTCRRGIELTLHGRVLANNSVIGLTRVTQGCSTLVCTTGSHVFRGNWYFPNKTLIRSASSRNGFFVTHGAYHEVYLHRRSGITHPSGIYCCIHYT